MFTLSEKELKTQTCREDTFIIKTCIADDSNNGCLFAVEPS